MDEEERELSTDEEDVVAPERDDLLRAAADRMRRESATGNPAQVGSHSTEFNARASGIFGGLGGAQSADAVSLRFWTSMHASARPPLDAPAAAGSASAAAEEWRPLDDLDALDSEEDLSQLEGEEGEASRRVHLGSVTRKRPHAEPRPLPADGEEQRERNPKVRTVTFDGAAAAVERCAPAERAGYRLYSLAGVDADAGSNRRAAGEAMELVRAQRQGMLTD
ncbi:hypothetical protein KFE25_002114 [Diacronema lutheri]|uniref:Uncharacterized protein n=1 Tax=Diacronema lutheri TaxID=2081491 RepID=A0A8J6CG55_DIALT|nr:hypothetical protein KFE25_002114 [Diacronema lutheri]